MKKIIMMLVLGALAAASQATLYFYDGFDYTAGTDLNTAGPAWKTAGTGSRSLTNAAGTLTYSGLQAGIGGQVKMGGHIPGAGQIYTTRAITNAVQVESNLFMSALINVTDVTGWNAPSTSGGQSTNTLFAFTTRGGVMLRADGTDGFNVGLVTGQTDTTIDWLATKFTLNTAHFIVVGLTNWNTNVGDGLSLWVNKTGTLGAADLSINPGNPAVQGSILLGSAYSGTTSGQVMLDEVRVGDLWNDVAPIPEPATVGMLGLGAIITLMVRRMKQA